MGKFLYGAAVQGIQSFIFSTNKLRDILGASELVEQVCTTMFDEFRKDGEDIVRAAGNIKYIFNQRKDCENAVLNFPKKVMIAAPGITISQAVVELEDDSNATFKKSVQKLEQKLRAQRNRPVDSLSIGLMGIRRSRATGLPATTIDKGDFLDEGTFKKREVTKAGSDNNVVQLQLCKKSFGDDFRFKTSQIPFDIKNMTGYNSWIAIIHADGNGLGPIVQSIGANKEVFSVFSKALDKATRLAANEAFLQTLGIDKKNAKNVIMNLDIIPLRPIVLSGDDMTTIIRGDLALKYAYEF